MGILASPVLTGLAPGVLPAGFQSIVGTFGGNSSGTGLIDISGTDSDTLLYNGNGISAQANSSLFIQQIINYVSPSGVPSLMTPVFRANSGGTSGYVFGIPSSSTMQLFTANFVTASFTARGSANTIAYVPAKGDVVNIYIIVSGTFINIFIWNNLYGRPSLPSISVSDSTIGSAGYSGMFAALVNSVAAQVPTVTQFIVGQGITYGAPSYSSGNANGVTVSIPSPTGGGGVAPYTYNILTSRNSGSPLSAENAVPGISGTFATAGAPAQTVTIPIVSGDLQYIRANYTDSGSTPESVLGNEIPIQARTALSFVFIGDSLTVGYQSTGSNDPVTLITPLLTANGSPSSVVTNNQGHGGASTLDWLPGASSNYLSTAITQANTQSCTDIHIMLGTNDSHLVLPAEQYKANMQLIINTLFASVPTLQRIVLCSPPFVGPNAAGGVYGEWCNQFLRQYKDVNLSLVDGERILPGADLYSAFAQQFLVNFSTVYNADNVHMTNTGYAYMAEMWFSAYAELFNPVVNTANKAISQFNQPLRINN